MEDGHPAPLGTIRVAGDIMKIDHYDDGRKDGVLLVVGILAAVLGIKAIAQVWDKAESHK